MFDMKPIPLEKQQKDSHVSDYVSAKEVVLTGDLKDKCIRSVLARAYKKDPYHHYIVSDESVVCTDFCEFGIDDTLECDHFLPLSDFPVKIKGNEMIVFGFWNQDKQKREYCALPKCYQTVW